MSMPMTQIPDPIQTVVAQARQAIAKASYTPFSSAGFAVLQDKIEQYIGDLVLEAVRVMDRRQADTVSPAYVQQASDNLVAGNRRRFYTLIGTVGGVLLGAAVSSYVEIMRGGSSSIPVIIVASSMAVLGAFLVALQFSRE